MNRFPTPAAPRTATPRSTPSSVATNNAGPTRHGLTDSRNQVTRPGRPAPAIRRPQRPPVDSGETRAGVASLSRRARRPHEDQSDREYLPLSRTTDRVLGILLEGDLARLRAENVAERLGISCTTLRRRLRSDHTNYQFLLDRARQYRCEARLRERWLPGKCLADELGYLEVNSFYRAFRRWTGMSYSAYKQAQEARRPAPALS